MIKNLLRKTLAFGVVSILLIENTALAQNHWTPIGNVDFRACQKLGDGRVCIATSGGYLLWSTDEGVSWTPQILDTASGLNSVSFPTDQTGYVGADSDRVYKTQDGGKSWRRIALDTNLAISHLTAPSSDTVFLCGVDGLIVRSTDGGDSWTPLKMSNQRRLRRLYFDNARHGYVIGDSMAFYETSDAGLHWSAISLPFAPGWYDYIGSLSVSPSGNMALGLDSFVVISTNHGITWTKKQVDHQIVDPFFVQYFGNDTLFSIHYNYFVYLSTDGGQTWDSTRLSNSGYLFSAPHFNDSWISRNGDVRLCGNSGTLYALNIPAIHNGQGTGLPIKEYSPQVGVIVSAIPHNSHSIRSISFQGFSSSTDDGYSWLMRDAVQANYIGVSFSADSTGVGLTTGTGQAIPGVFTTNNGATWTYLSNTQWIKHNWSRVETRSDSSLFLLGDTLIAISTDGGYQWTPWASIDHATDFGHIFAVGGTFWGQDSAYVHIRGDADSLPSHVLFRTTDSGRHWERRSIPGDASNNCRTWFINPAIGIGANTGGQILRTSDGGDSWQTQQIGTVTGSFSAAAFNSTGTIGIVAGRNSELYETFDSGKSWVADFPKPFCVSGQKNVTSIAFLDDTTAVIGYPSTLFRRTFSHSFPTEAILNVASSEMHIDGFPNPAQNTIKFKNLEGPIMIFDALGRMHTCPFESGTLNVTELPAGIYYLNRGRLRARFVKQ